VQETFRLHAAPADLTVVEGVMGLFDGLGADPFEGSSAQIAALTGVPVVLTVNARGMAASAAALVQGFAAFDHRVRLAGVIFNNVGSTSHGELLRQALAAALPGVALFGCIPRDEAVQIPSRHLGLVTAEDNPLPPAFLDRLADLAERWLDLDALAALEIPPIPPLIKGGELPHHEVCPVPPFAKGEAGGISGVKIAIARDAAFCFCYPDNLRLLREAGGELVFFSPLNDDSLPAGIAGIYLPGGYPELYAEQLAANRGMREAIRAAIAGGMPVYAECGGLIYLTDGVEDGGDFVGVFPTRVRMLPQRKALGYRQAELTGECPIGRAGDVARGHEFHYSEICGMPATVERRYRVSRRGDSLGEEGYRYRNCLASYLHLHFGSNPTLAPSFVAACKWGGSVLKD
jgi:cobyrinic acid a,c-diamide synthase